MPILAVLVVIAQIVVAAVLLAVWLYRPNRPTEYRGGNARTMSEEFAVYGLPHWMMYVVGALKVTAALALLVGIRFHALVFPAAFIVFLLMVGAVVMHFKVQAPSKKFIPALILLVLTAGISFLSRG